VSSPYLPRQWAIIGSWVTVEIPLGKAATEPAQAMFHHSPNCFSATAVDGVGESSRTWRTPAYDVADRIPARSDPARPCRRARCTEGSAHRNEVPLRRADDSRYPEYALPQGSAHPRASACALGLAQLLGVGDDRSSAGCRRGQLLWARRTTAETMKAMSRICLTPESCGPVGDRAAEEVGDQAG
jgi:hypothetical protein